MEQAGKLEAFRRSMTAQMNADLDHIEKIKQQLLEKQTEQEHLQAEQGEAACISAARTRAEQLTRQSAARARRDSRQKLLQLRQEMTKTVFAKAREKLRAFADSAEYGPYLTRCVIEMREALPQPDAVLFVRAQDKNCDAVLKNWDGEVQAAEDILLGGARAETRAEGLFADCTLDTALEEQDEWFRMHHTEIGVEDGDEA